MSLAKASLDLMALAAVKVENLLNLRKNSRKESTWLLVNKGRLLGLLRMSRALAFPESAERGS